MDASLKPLRPWIATLKQSHSVSAPCNLHCLTLRALFGISCVHIVSRLGVDDELTPWYFSYDRMNVTSAPQVLLFHLFHLSPTSRLDTEQTEAWITMLKCVKRGIYCSVYSFELSLIYPFSFHSTLTTTCSMYLK